MRAVSVVCSPSQEVVVGHSKLLGIVMRRAKLERQEGLIE
jgi:hypothetical protein